MPPPLPARIGPVEFGALGTWVTVRCPKELTPIIQRSGALWDPASRRWLVERRRIGPVIRELRKLTDPLFQRVGISLD